MRMQSCWRTLSWPQPLAVDGEAHGHVTYSV
jgi:hypothetical protein